MACQSGLDHTASGPPMPTLFGAMRKRFDEQSRPADTLEDVCGAEPISVERSGFDEEARLLVTEEIP